MANIKNESPAQAKQPGIEKEIRLDDNTIANQQQRLLAWLSEKAITTIEARHELNILAPAARIFELRHKFGLNIKTIWTEDVTPEGKPHKVVRYFLAGGGHE